MKLTVRDAARFLDLPEERIYELIREGSIPVTHVREQYRFNKIELLEWATAKGLRVSVDLLQTGASDSAALPSLPDALGAGGIHLGIRGSDRETVLRALIQSLKLSEDVDRAELTDILLARESLGSTGVGDGIAIPHVRSPVVVSGSGASIALCYLEQPLDFDAIDGRPVDTLFFLITPSPRAHLHLLARLAAALHDEGFKRAVKGRAPIEKLLEEARRVEAAFLKRSRGKS